MRDEHADACCCHACAEWPEPEGAMSSARIVWLNKGRASPEPLAKAIEQNMPKVLGSDLRAIYQPGHDIPAPIVDAASRAEASIASIHAERA